MCNPCLLSLMASCDVASYFRQPLGRGDSPRSGGAGKGGGSGGGGNGGANGVSPEMPREAFLAQLSSITWVPVEVEPPPAEPGLPWPLGAPPVAPPKMVRPRPDAWLCSATLRVLVGEPQSLALADLLGWRAPLSPTILAAQLLALGDAHPVIRDPAAGAYTRPLFSPT